MQQRQLKFRAWDSARKELASQVQKYITAEDGTEFIVDAFVFHDGPDVQLITFPVATLHDERFKLEQFTGLLDKNGKEIYEGDIVENTTDIYREDEHDGRVPTGATQTSRAVVAWDAHWALFRVARDIERGRLEVIGNIHENPDLIESGNTTKEE